MSSPKILPQNPVEVFNSKFKYAWNSEKGKPRITAEHYIVTWSIDNLSLLLLEGHKSVSSPKFLLDSSKTEWYIEIYPNGLCNEDLSIDLILYRSDDNGPRNVGLTFRFGVLQTDDRTMRLKEKKIENFRQKTFSTVRIEGAERATLSRNMFQYCNIFVVKCEMYVTFPDTHYDEILLTPADYDLINFSFDLTKLMMAIEITDYRVNVPGFSINTHKAILAARSATFREILSNEDSSTEVNFRDIALDNIRRVLQFMYSGNISMVLNGEPPSIGFYECAEKFAVVDLVTLLAPKCLHLRSVLKYQEFNYTWNVRNFIKLTTLGIISKKSPPFGAPCEKSPKWYLSVDFDRVLDQLSVFVETSGESKALHSIMKISLLDGKGELFNTKETTQFKKPKEKFGFPEFLKDFTSHNLMHDLLINDSLQVHCELIFVFSIDVHEVHDLTISWPSNFLDIYRNLSNNVSQLFKTSEFSDVIVKTRDYTMFEVHRSILFARSRKFYSKFMYYNKGERVLDVLDIDPDLVGLMFEHTYSGMLKPMPLDVMLRLHKAANLYVFRHLTLITHHHLASQINMGNFFELLMVGKTLEDRYLEEKCMLFACENAKKIMEITNWDKYKDDDKGLCEFLITILIQEVLKQ